MLPHRTFIKKAEKVFEVSDYEERAFLYYFDFAEFAFVNRIYGLEGGNTLLTAAEERLNQIPWVHACERIIADQFIFLVIADKPRSEEELVSIYASFAENFIASCRSQYPACNLRTYCGICPVHGGNIVEAVVNAQVAWRKAKQNFMTTAVVFNDSLAKELTELQKMESESNLALKEERFTFYLQPKVNLLTGKITGAEALARRLNPTGSVIYPDSFLPIMEKNGSIIELDRLILRKVCAHMKERMEKGLPLVRTSVNLSRLHVQVWNEADVLHSIVQEFGIPPELLEFEMTETAMIGQMSAAMRLGGPLKDRGYTLSIDDFGAGYAGVVALQELDFDVLKLDRRFLTEEEPMHSRNRIILPDIIHSLNKLHIEPICEGVETAEQCRYLASIGCTTVQDYYFSKPVPPDQFYQIYDERKGHFPLLFMKPSRENESAYL